MIEFAPPLPRSAQPKARGQLLPCSETTTADPSSAASREGRSAASVTPGPFVGATQKRRRWASETADEIARLSAHIEAATARLLDLIGRFEESLGWHEEGFTSCAHWLSWRTGVSPGAAREKVRVACALRKLPTLRTALRRGQLSYSAARAITRVATPETEAGLVETARHATAAQLERLVGALRAADRSEEAARHAQRCLSLTATPDGSWTIVGRLDPEVGAVLYRALEAASEELYHRTPPDLDAAAERPAAARRGDALGLLAEAALGQGLRAGSSPTAVLSRAERFQVVMHVSAETLARPVGASRAYNGPPRTQAFEEGSSAMAPPRVADIRPGSYVSAETSRRLSCDAALVVMTDDSRGSVLDVGRRRRTVPLAIRRVLQGRDRGCRFPGCRARHCDAHHVKHWADGGDTAVENLLLLCRHHHRRVHEDGWRVELEPNGDVSFYRPDGRLLPRVPARPAVPSDPVQDLERHNSRSGIDIDAWTPTPNWTGEPLDLDWAVFTLSPRPPQVLHGVLDRDSGIAGGIIM